AGGNYRWFSRSIGKGADTAAVVTLPIRRGDMVILGGHIHADRPTIGVALVATRASRIPLVPTAGCREVARITRWPGIISQPVVLHGVRICYRILRLGGERRRNTNDVVTRCGLLAGDAQASLVTF